MSHCVLRGTAPIAVGVLTHTACGGDEVPTTIAVSDVGDDAVFEHDSTIPLGTADRVAADESAEPVPREMDVAVGGSIRIVDADDEGHVVGVFDVGAGETITKHFAAAGVLDGECSVHPGGRSSLCVGEG